MQAEVAQFFLGEGLGEHLAGHLGAVQVVQADEHRVDAADDGVVDLEVGDLGDAALLHVGDGARFPQGHKRAAVAVGGEGQRVFAFEQHLAVEADRRHLVLGKEGDVFGFHAEEVVLLPESAGGGVVLRRGHDVKRDFAAIAFPQGQQVFGKALEEGFLFDGRGREGAFRAVPAKARRPARRRRRTRRSCPGGGVASPRAKASFILACRAGSDGLVLIVAGGLDVALELKLGRVLDDPVNELVDERPVQGFELRGELGLLLRGEFLPEAEDVGLARSH